MSAALRLEGLAIAAFALTLYVQSDRGWGLFLLLILAPDLAMAGYVLGPRIGALSYNMVHSYVAPAFLAATGWLSGSEALFPVALVWVVHLGLDRTLGYGLKYASGFQDTHLNRV
ncbi:MAG: DUF4260 domain-containing protein [Sulfitobacter sp.]|nr:DUF4260 domain-containing protein [Sulfitobacter sp.]